MRAIIVKKKFYLNKTIINNPVHSKVHFYSNSILSF